MCRHNISIHRYLWLWGSIVDVFYAMSAWICNKMATVHIFWFWDGIFGILYSVFCTWDVIFGIWNGVFVMAYLVFLRSIWSLKCMMCFKCFDYFSSGTPTMFVDMLAQVFSNFNWIWLLKDLTEDLTVGQQPNADSAWPDLIQVRARGSDMSSAKTGLMAGAPCPQVRSSFPNDIIFIAKCCLLSQFQLLALTSICQNVLTCP